MIKRRTENGVQRTRKCTRTRHPDHSFCANQGSGIFTISCTINCCVGSQTKKKPRSFALNFLKRLERFQATTGDTDRPGNLHQRRSCRRGPVWRKVLSPLLNLKLGHDIVKASTPLNEPLDWLYKSYRVKCDGTLSRYDRRNEVHYETAVHLFNPKQSH